MIALYRQEVRPFSEKEIALVQTDVINPVAIS
jgi:hypothetical protein